MTVARTRAALEHGAASLVDELRLSLDFYGAQEAAVAVERIVLCGPGSALPGLAEEMEPQVGLPIAVGRPARPRRLRRRHRGAPHPAPRNRPRRSDAPRQPDPARGAPRQPPAAAVGSARLHRRRRARRGGDRDHRRWSSPKTRSPTSKAEVTQLQAEQASITAKAQALSPYTQFATVREQRLATVTEPRRQPLRLGADPARTLAGHPRQRAAHQPRRQRPPGVGGAGGGGSALRSQIAGPALEMVGCTTSQAAVAGFIEAVKDIDGVTRVGVPALR